MTSKTGEKKQCSKCSISQELNVYRQWNVVSKQNITEHTFSLKNHKQNVVGRLVPDPFLKKQSLAYRWINNVKYLQFVQ